MLPTFASANFAPLKPLLDVRAQASSQPKHYFCDAMRERFEHFVGLHKDERREMLASSQQLALMLQGHARLAYNPYKGLWTAVRPKVETSDTRRSLNVIQRYVTEWIAKWQQSNPDVVLKPLVENEHIFGGTKAADNLLDRYEQKLYPASFSEQEAQQCFVFGNYVEQLVHQADAMGNVLLREVFEDVDIPLDGGYGSCHCGYEGEAAEFQTGAGEQCPQCQSPLVFTAPPNMQTLTMPTGTEEVPFGDFELRLLPFASCYWDFQHKPEASPYFIYRQNVPLGQVQAVLGEIRIPGEPDGDFGQQLVEALAHSGSAVSGVSNHGQRASLWRDQVTIDTAWFQPECYADLKSRGDEQTVSGQAIPPDVSYAKLFPQGMCLIGLNGLKMISGVHAEQHEHYLSSGTLHTKPLSGAGRNGGDIIEPAKRFDKFDNQAIAAFDAMGSPGGAYAKDALAPGDTKYIGKAGYYVPVDVLQSGGRLADVVQQFQPGVVSPQMLEYSTIFLRNMIEGAAHVVQMDQAQSNVDINTLGGQELATAAAMTLLKPLLMRKAECRIETAKNLMRLVQKHFPDEIVAQMLGRNGQMLAAAFRQVNFETDVSWGIVADSEIPRSTYTKARQMGQFLEQWGGAAGLQQAQTQFPQLVAESARAMNVNLESVDADDVAQRCLQRFEFLQQTLASGVVDPTAAAQLIQPMIYPSEPYHEAKLQWWQAKLDEDECWQDPVLRAAVDAVCGMHFAAIGQVSGLTAQQIGQSYAQLQAGVAPVSKGASSGE